jgi:uncharacterized protein (DUF1015 family)
MRTLTRPFAALRPLPDAAQSVIAPPYDVVDTEEARALAEGRPESFLHISRPEIDFPPSTDAHAAKVYAKAAENLARLVASGVLEREASRCYYVYRMQSEAHTQTGVALTASVLAYEAGLIHRHERTRPDKESDRVRNIEALNAQTGPVLLAYKTDARLDALLAEASAHAPLLEAEGQHGVVHSVWRVDDRAAVGALTAALDALGELYIADGHHRSAAAARVAVGRRGGRKGSVPSTLAGSGASHEYFLSVAFPDDQMQIFDYNRVVGDLNGMDAACFVRAVAGVLTLEPAEKRVKPRRPRTFGMYLAGRWYRLEAAEPGAEADPAARLDVSILQSRVIGPLLGIADPRTDRRIDFVGGVRGLGELERRVDSGKAAVAFALHPTGMRELTAVADEGLLMPPKSTWFEPKLADGLLSHVLD